MEKYLAFKSQVQENEKLCINGKIYKFAYWKGAKPSEILTLTFTNKAAAKMSRKSF